MKQKIIEILSGLQSDSYIDGFVFEDKPTANVRLDKKGDVVGVLYQFTDFDLDFSTGLVKETAEINVSFLQKESKLDAGGNEQYDIVSEMKDVMMEFLRRLKAVSEYVITDKVLNIKTVFLNTDSNRTGVNCQLTLKQKQGSCF